MICPASTASFFEDALAQDCKAATFCTVFMRW